jgi:hypothetical protein
MTPNHLNNGRSFVAPPSLPYVPFDVDALMGRLVQKNPAPINKDGLRIAVAVEVREAVRDSRLLLGLSLPGNGTPTELDVLGLVQDQKLAIHLVYGALPEGHISGELAHLERICALDPELIGLALFVASEPPLGSTDTRPLLEWHRCESSDDSPWTRLQYAYLWTGVLSNFFPNTVGGEDRPSASRDMNQERAGR